MNNAKSNSGAEKSPQPKAVAMFKGIKGLVASGAGTKKTADVAKTAAEKNQGAKIPQDAMKKMPTMVTAKPAGVVMPKGGVSVAPGIRPDPMTKRDSAGVAKPNTNPK